MADYFVHEKALVETEDIGSGSQIWAFVHVLPGARIGRNANICDHCYIENEVIIGDNVTIKNGVYLWEGLTIEDDVFIGPAAVFTNDLAPRSKNPGYERLSVVLKRGCSVGAGAVILAGRTIGRYAFVGAGAVVTRDVEDYTLVYGNPARQQGFVCVCRKRLGFRGDSCVCSCGRTYELRGSAVFAAEE